MRWLEDVPRRVSELPATIQSNSVRGPVGWPNQVADTYWRAGKRSGLADLTIEVAAAAVESGLQAYVCQGTDHNWITTLIVGVNANRGVVVLGNGEVKLWESLLADSLWGEHLVLVWANDAPLIAHTPLDSDGPGMVLEPDGGVANHPALLEELRDRVRKAPNDAIANRAYVHALKTVPAGPQDNHARPAEILRALALASARLPKLAWPRRELARLANFVIPDPFAQSLAVLDALDDAPESGPALASLARATPASAYEHLSRVRAHDAADELILEAWADHALATGAADDARAAVELITKVHPGNDNLVRLKVNVEVLAKGHAGALRELSASSSDELGVPARVSLALQSADPALLRDVAAAAVRDEAMTSAGADAALVLALHGGDVAGCVAAFGESARRHGLTELNTAALADVAGGLAPPQHARALLAEAVPFFGAQPHHAASLLNSLAGTHLWPVALELARTFAVSGSAPVTAEHAFARCVLLAAPRMTAADRLTHAQSALDAMESVRADATAVTLWRHIRASLLVHTDPGAAQEALMEAPRGAVPLASLALGVTIARALGDNTRADSYQRRMVNPELLRHGLFDAGWLGLSHVADPAVAALDAHTFPNIVWTHFLHGGGVPALPQQATFDQVVLSNEALDRLARAGRWTELRDATAASASAGWYGLVDGTHARAYEALAAAGVGDGAALSELVANSRHPAVTRAARIATSFGVSNFDAPVHDAPGVAADLEFLGVGP